MEKKINYEKLANECLGWLDMAIMQLKANADWTGNMRDKKSGEYYSWQEGMARTMDKFPSVSVDRRYIEAQYLSAKERRKELMRLNEESK